MGDDHLRSIYADDPEFRELLIEYVKEVGQIIDQIRKAILDEETEQAALTAHQLKGSAGMYGYPLLSEAAGALERDLKQQTSGFASEPRVQQLDAIWERIKCGLGEL